MFYFCSTALWQRKLKTAQRGEGLSAGVQVKGEAAGGEIRGRVRKGMASPRMDFEFSPKDPHVQSSSMSLCILRILRNIILAAVWRAVGKETKLEAMRLIRKLLHFSR